MNVSQCRYPIKNCDGFTLLEFLIAASLGAGLVILAITFCSHCILYGTKVSQFSEQLESARYFCFFLRTRLRSNSGVIGFSESSPIYDQLKIKRSTDALEVMTLRNNKILKMFLYISEVSYPSNHQSTYAFFMKEEGKPRIEVVSGITDLKILYGIKCPNTNNVCSYQNVKEIADWSKVVSMKIKFITEGEKSLNWRMYIAC